MHVQVHRSFQDNHLGIHYELNSAKHHFSEERNGHVIAVFLTVAGEVYVQWPLHKGISRCMLIFGTQPPSLFVCLYLTKKAFTFCRLTSLHIYNGHWHCPPNLRMFNCLTISGFVWNVLLKLPLCLWHCFVPVPNCPSGCTMEDCASCSSLCVKSLVLMVCLSATARLQATQQPFDWFTRNATKKNQQTDWPSDGVLNSK